MDKAYSLRKQINHMLFYMLSTLAILLFFVGLGLLNMSRLKQAIKEKIGHSEKTGTAQTIDSPRNNSEIVEKPIHIQKTHTKSYTALRSVIDRFPSVDYIPTVFKVYRNVRKANEYKPVEGFGRFASALSTYLFESYARSFHLSPSEKYERILTATKFGHLGDTLDDIIDTKGDKDVSEFMDSIYDTLIGKQDKIPEGINNLERSCYRLAKDLGNSMRSLNKRIMSKEEFESIIYADSDKQPARKSLYEVRHAQEKTAGEYWTYITDIVAPYDLNKTERDAIKTIGIGVQILDDVSDYKQDKEEGGSANTVITFENLNGGKYHTAVSQAYDLSKKYLAEGFKALESDSVRPEVKEAMKNIYEKFNMIYSIEKRVHISGKSTSSQ